jgi:hypothetical protein
MFKAVRDGCCVFSRVLSKETDAATPNRLGGADKICLKKGLAAGETAKIVGYCGQLLHMFESELSFVPTLGCLFSLQFASQTAGCRDRYTEPGPR